MRSSHSIDAPRLVGIALLLLGTCLVAAESGAQQPPPVKPATPSGILPVEVTIPSGVTTPEQARPYFDDFSWRSFIAFNWPAVPGRHGVPKSPNDPNIFL
jgi:hypothetical protein